MKKLIFIIFLMLLSCGVTKDKTKTKSSFETNQQSALDFKSNINRTIDSIGSKKDSTAGKTSSSNAKANLSVLQNFTLKNSGKCENGGETRFVNFTDAVGNKTSIPVNDNTELNFDSSIDLQKQIETLTVENTSLKRKNSTLKSKLESESETKVRDEKSESGSDASTDVKTEKNSFSSYAFFVLLGIVVYELLKQFIKKLILIKI